MEKEFSLNEAERKVFRSTTQDGLVDILIGCVVLQFAIAPLFSSRLGDFWSSAIFLPFYAIVFTAIVLVRKSVIVPRIGIVKFSKSRKNLLSKFILIMLIINLIAFIIGVFYTRSYNVPAGLLYSATMGFLILVLSSIAAYFLECKRFFVYGCLFFISLIVGEWLFLEYKVAHHGFPITFSFTSGVIIITGIIMFVRLLRHNPIMTTEPIPEEQTK